MRFLLNKTKYYQNFYNWYLAKYYKRNVTIIGSPIATVSEITSFSASNYAVFFMPSDSYFELILKFRTSSTTEGTILSMQGNTNKLGITSNKLGFVNNTPAWVFSSIATTANTTYWARLVFSGGNVTVSFQKDNGYTLDTLPDSWTGTITASSLSPSDRMIYLGRSSEIDQGAYPWYGSIDLSGCVCKNANGDILWQGWANNTVGFPNVATVGSIDIDYQSGIVSRFTTAHYLTLPDIFAPSREDNWEMVWKVNTGDFVSSADNVIMGQQKDYGLSLFVNTSKFNVGIGSNKLFGKTTLSPNTDYWVKLVATYSKSDNLTVREICMYISLDGSDWVQDGITSGNSFTPVSRPQYVGVWYNFGISNNWKGSIDLSESYIKINGEYWWQGKSPEAADYSASQLLSANTRTYDGEYTRKELVEQVVADETDYDEIVNEYYCLTRKMYYQNFYNWYQDTPEVNKSDSVGAVSYTGSLYSTEQGVLNFNEEKKACWSSSSGSVTYTYDAGNYLPIGEYTIGFGFSYDPSYPNRKLGNPTWTVTYSDNTTAQIFYISGLYNTGEYTVDFTASKPIKALTFSHSSSSVSTITGYVAWTVWSAKYLLSSNTRTYDGEYTSRELVEQAPATNDDYDEIVNKPYVFRRPNSTDNFIVTDGGGQ